MSRRNTNMDDDIGGEELVWDDNRQEYVPPSMLKREVEARLDFYMWQADDLLPIIKSTKCAELAVLARLHELRVLKRKGSFELTNEWFQEMGISSYKKRQALKALEKSGKLSVEWAERASPLVTLKFKKHTSKRI